MNAYRIARYDAVTNAVAAIGSGCSGSVAALTCIENAVTPGSWDYRITPEHQSWVGSEGPPSATVVVASPTLTFASGVTITALPSVKTGTIASFVAGEIRHMASR